jgi:hypothetical protein
MANLPFSVIGSVAVNALSGIGLSLGAIVGLVTVFGMSARNAILQLAHYEHLVEVEGSAWSMNLVLRGANERLIPILMTAAHSMGASRWQIFRWVIFPHMIPTFFAGMRLGMTGVLLGVLLAELYVSTRHGRRRDPPTVLDEPAPVCGRPVRSASSRALDRPATLRASRIY